VLSGDKKAGGETMAILFHEFFILFDLIAKLKQKMRQLMNDGKPEPFSGFVFSIDRDNGNTLFILSLRKEPEILDAVYAFASIFDTKSGIS
jgi:hypothetical protein